MSEVFEGGGRLPAAFMNPGTSSFTDFLSAVNPELLPGQSELPQNEGNTHLTPEGTTIVALTFPGGVVLAGDRRATSGNVIANRDIDKLFRADEFSAMAIAGAAGIGTELAKLFQVELEHYEKMEGRSLSLEGKANKLATMIRSNLSMALQGFVVIPVLVGFDEELQRGRIYSYDPVGGRYEEHRFHGIGSGAVYARGSLKKLFTDDLSESDAVTVAVQALYDAADDDSATGGPDMHRKIYPLIDVITEEGHRRLPTDEVAQVAQSVVEARSERPDGPTAPVR
ncbi:proteasome endopeptidase complex beta subunit [Haloactinospora alba]|uniref:Proteasome subunit beta n=1 Tax=Haloactinospora alba TaxID=405555 RepID=A0A543NJ58_9ACTN|nr:proteasome subunit beta [Haloactinospora alba]TQN31780.1 proteasome endopeptidase complex beta subunit [Haloactinospora alba]